MSLSRKAVCWSARSCPCRFHVLRSLFGHIRARTRKADGALARARAQRGAAGRRQGRVTGRPACAEKARFRSIRAMRCSHPSHALCWSCAVVVMQYPSLARPVMRVLRCPSAVCYPNHTAASRLGLYTPRASEDVDAFRKNDKNINFDSVRQYEAGAVI